MEREFIEKYLNEKVRIITINQDFYVGTITRCSDDSFIILDKYENESQIMYGMVGIIKGVR